MFSILESTYKLSTLDEVIRVFSGLHQDEEGITVQVNKSGCTISEKILKVEYKLNWGIDLRVTKYSTR